jgi:ergothioneine biosynthesis glutamate--cysteine ligase EgtA
MAAQHGSAIEAPVPIPRSASDRCSLDEARAHIVAGALSPSSIGTVGLELEMHLVDLDAPAQRISWDRLTAVVAGLPPMPAGSPITVEPGGQVELSTLPMADVSAAVAALDADRQALTAAFAPERLGLASLGADPARSVQRLNPKSRYVEMEAHFLATGSGDAGRSMMCSTAALQINVEAGPAAKMPIRVSRMHRIGPVLVAISACSPWLAGRSSGWRSMRQQVWGEIDQARCGALLVGAHPEQEWASYALHAPVMLIRDPFSGEATALTERISLGDWVSGKASLGRPATIDDVDYHLSTLFPPVRPRGFLELRCLDAVPHRWWPGLAGIAVTLLDDPIAADLATEACLPITDAWTAAARIGLDDPTIARAARECVAAAVDRAPVELKNQMATYAELVVSGRTPGDEVRAMIERDGPLATLEALAHEGATDAV